MTLRTGLLGLALALGGTAAADLSGSRKEAPPPPGTDEALESLDLEALLDTEVTSVSRRSERRAAAPAAITVITAEDIRRRGVTTIAELLRGVPGVNVAQVDANKWSISARGFSERFANMLLVMIDGRSLYTPLFGGTYWDVQDTLLEDIDRIEVIRGPGGTLWGANAVNGVIHIITKHASETQGALASTLSGNQEHLTTGLRYGGRIGDALHYRVFGKYLNRTGHPGGEGRSDDDEWSQQRVGFRMDWDPTADSSLMLQGAWYNGFSGGTGPGPVSAAPFDYAGPQNPVPIDAYVAGYHVLARYTHRFAEDLDLAFQAYVDNTQREDDLWRENRLTWDFDLAMHLPTFWRNEIDWGLRYRNASDHFGGRQFPVDLANPERRDHLFSGYIQDHIRLVPEKLTLTIGTKLEHNSYTGFEYQPSGRFAWTPNRQHTVWGAASRVVRVPTRADRDLRFTLRSPELPFSSIDPTSVASFPTVVQINVQGGDPQATVLVAYELGYRFMPLENLEFDWAVFLNRYRRLAETSEELGSSAIFGTPVFIEATSATTDKRDARTYGSEFTISYRPFEAWRLDLAYSFIRVDFHERLEAATEADQEEDDADLKREAQREPSHMWTLRSQVDLPYGFELDGFLHIVGNRAFEASSYARLDFRLGWRPTEQLELSFSALNVLHEQHREFGAVDLIFPNRVPRSFHGRATLRF